MTRSRAGFTLLEMLMATTIFSVTVAGTMSAFLTALRIRQAGRGPMAAEGMGYAEEWLERNRNHIAADDAWLSAKEAGPVGPPYLPNWIGTDFAIADRTWNDDLVTPGETALAPWSVKRRYKVNRVECDGNAANGPECYRLAVRVCWNDATCP